MVTQEIATLHSCSLVALNDDRIPLIDIVFLFLSMSSATVFFTQLFFVGSSVCCKPAMHSTKELQHATKSPVSSVYLIPPCFRGEVNNTIGRVGQCNGRGLLPEQNTYTVIILNILQCGTCHYFGHFGEVRY
jgi:hypothetical protein